MCIQHRNNTDGFTLTEDAGAIPDERDLRATISVSTLPEQEIQRIPVIHRIMDRWIKTREALKTNDAKVCYGSPDAFEDEKRS
jgi:hypothetical protein